VKRLAAILLLFLTGCGQAHPVTTPVPPSKAAATTASSPTSRSATRLFVIAEGNPGCFGAPCTVAIVDVDGHVQARRTFKPQPQAVVGCEGSWIYAPVQVVGNGAYYLDDSGMVRRLSASGAVTEIAQFPIRTTQQVVWFAVSPDGSKVMAAIMVYTPLSPSWNPQQGCPVHEPGRVHQEIDLATVGGSTTVLSDQTNPSQVTSIVGWDETGPIAVPDSHMAYIGYIGGTVWGGPAVHLDLRAHPVGGSIGGANCSPFFGEVRDGNLVCHDPKRPTVRDSAGKVLWALKALDPTDDFSYGAISVSPDASRVAFNLNSKCCYTFDSSVIRSRDGVRIGLGSSFQPQGWLDEQTIIGARGSLKPMCSGCPPDFVPTTLGIIELARPAEVRDLGISGTFLGVLQGQ
jgi:hypothetical protein